MVPIIRRHVRVPAVGIGFVALAVAGILLTDPVTSEKARLAAPTAQPASSPVTAEARARTDGSEGQQVPPRRATGAWKLLVA